MVQSRSGIDNNTVLVLHCEDATDSCGNLSAPLLNHGVATYVDGVFGKAISYGNTNYLKCSFNNSLGTYFNDVNIYTLDFWVKPPTTNTSGNILASESSQSSYFRVEVSKNNNNVQVRVNGTYTFTGANDEYVDKFMHIGVTSDGTTTYTYINGVKQETTVNTLPICSKTSSSKYLNTLKVGSSTNAPIVIDELRLSSVQRYSDNFTPPTRPYSLPYYPTVVSSTEDSVTVTFETNIDKLEVYINDVLDKEYTSDIGIGTYKQHFYNKELFTDSDNIIKIVSYYSGLEASNTFTYKSLPKLSQYADYSSINLRLKDVKDRVNKLKEELIEVLTFKGVTVSPTLSIQDIIPLVLYVGDDEIPLPPSGVPTITKITTSFSVPYIHIDTKGLITEDTTVDLYSDDVLLSSRTFYVSSSTVSFNNINNSDILNKHIHIDFRNGIVTDKFYVETIG